MNRYDDSKVVNNFWYGSLYVYQHGLKKGCGMANLADGFEKLPTYLEVYNRLYTDLAERVYEPGSRLPGEIELARRYGTGRYTLRQALLILAEDGLIVKQRGSGNYVCLRPQRKASDPTEIVNPVLSYALCTVDAVSVQHNFGPPTDVAQRKLHIGPKDFVLAANCAYRSASRIVAHSFVQIASAFLKELGVDPAAPKNVDELLKNTLYVHAKAADVSFRAIRAMGELAWRMDAQEGEPVLYIEQVLYGRGGDAFARLKHHLFPSHYDVSFSVLSK